MNTPVEVRTHHDNFQKVGIVIQAREQYILRSGAVTQEMTQYINAIIQENEQKSPRITSQIGESQARLKSFDNITWDSRYWQKTSGE